MTPRTHNPADALPPLADDANPLDRAVHNLENSRRSINYLLEWGNAIVAERVKQAGEEAGPDADTALALAMLHGFAALYGPLSAIGNALVVIAEAEPTIVTSALDEALKPHTAHQED